MAKKDGGQRTEVGADVGDKAPCRLDRRLLDLLVNVVGLQLLVGHVVELPAGIFCVRVGGRGATGSRNEGKAQ